ILIMHNNISILRNISRSPDLIFVDPTLMRRIRVMTTVPAKYRLLRTSDRPLSYGLLRVRDTSHVASLVECLPHPLNFGTVLRRCSQCSQSNKVPKPTAWPK